MRRNRPRWWRNVPLVLALLAAAAATYTAYSPSSAKATATGTNRGTAAAVGTTTEQVDGRSFILHISGTSPRPLVLMLHGWKLPASEAETQTGFSGYGDSHGFDVAYPESADVLSSWNAGSCCGGDHANDVAYLDDVVAEVRTLTPVTRAYIAGFSNGGMMALAAACESDVFTAAASVAGPLLIPCPKPIRGLELQGDTDTTVPAHGGYSTFTGTTFPDSTTQTAVTVRIFHGGHTWPTGATAEIWDFLSRN